MDITKVQNLNTKYPKRVEKYVEMVVEKFEQRGLFLTKAML